ncbi:MAG TPA: adenylate/guanylate cyclase domain-containing protein [Candidatus Elarobacter sp.]
MTFLFSDIEGSTVRWERNRDAMAAALARHDALMRMTIERSGGYVFKTIGDAFCAAFATAPQAMAAAIDAQRTLLSEDFSAVDGVRVRMALHTGHADERDGDYFGPAVNRVARLLAIGHGGQVLVSGTATDLLQGEMPPQSSLRDLGAHRLKDLARPEQVYQLIAPDLPETFPALRSLDELPNNLPRQLSSFVGREDVLTEIVALIERSPLVTLVGTGGAGKTRCAVQVGAEVLDGSGDGVWLVELAPISDPALVPSVIAHALNVQESPPRPVLDIVVAYLKRKRLLLILDNCEHVIAQVRTVAAAILRSCPDVRILATSREGLNIAGERVFRIPSLSAPPASDTLTPQAALQYGAVALFTDRALASDGRFALAAENAPFVAEICRRLDGIPLAIELAAARVKVLAPQQLAQKLDERFRVLTGGDRSALPRQQTMRALIDWSYDLLADEERTVFRKLSVFAGGFTLETASTVCSDERVDEIAVLDLLSSLVDKSLVQAEPAGSGTRYRLLESTRQYAREKLVESGEKEAVARAHATAFVELVERLERAWDTTPERAWFAHVEPELENCRAALEWALTGRREIQGLRLAGALRGVWSFLGAAEGRHWVWAALEAVDPATPVPVVAKLHLAKAVLDGTLKQYKASYAAAEEALARYRELGDALGIAHAQRVAGGALVFLGRVSEGEALLREALAAARGFRKRTASLLQDLAVARHFAEDLAGARAHFAEALAISKALGDARKTAFIAGNLADAEFRGGDAARAVQLAGEALADDRARNDRRGVEITVCNMAAYLLALDRYDEARSHAREALALSRDLQAGVLLAISLQHLAAVAALRQSEDAEGMHQDRTRAARLLGYVDTCLTTLEALREYTEQQEYDKMIAALREAFGEDTLAKLMDEGRAWSEDHAVDEALLV